MIDPQYYGLVELVLIIMLVFGFGLQQLWSLRRAKRRAEESGDARHPEGQHPPRDG